MSTLREDAQASLILFDITNNSQEIASSINTIKNSINSINLEIATLETSPMTFATDALAKVSTQVREDLLQSLGDLSVIGEVFAELSRLANLDGTNEEIRVSIGGSVKGVPPEREM